MPPEQFVLRPTKQKLERLFRPEGKNHGMPRTPFDHVWYWRSRLPERKGERCRVVTRGRLNSVLVEFPDGFRAVTSRYAVRAVSTPATHVEPT